MFTRIASMRKLLRLCKRFFSKEGNCKDLPSQQHIEISGESLETVVRRCSVKKVFLEILQNSQENNCAESLLNKFAGLRSATLLRKRSWHRCFPVNFAKFLKNTFQKQPCRGVLSKRFSKNMQQIYRRTSMPKGDFNKVAKQLY